MRNTDASTVTFNYRNKVSFNKEYLHLTFLMSGPSMFSQPQKSSAKISSRLSCKDIIIELRFK